MRVRISLAVFALVCFPSSNATAQIVPDGTTATSSAVAPDGRAKVSIASPSGGVSHNSYSSFSVAPAGVDLDNRAAGARTIVNEVTSTRRSTIAGPVDVVGPRAHLIIANPTGITLDGASFSNTGGVGLVAGTVRRSPGADGRIDVVARAGGEIDVTGGGVRGSMASLQMLAGRLP
jgi:filamentous hemagglutinin family protein